MRKYNFPTHISGDTFNGVKFRITKDDVPVDLTSAIIKMYCKSSPNNVYDVFIYCRPNDSTVYYRIDDLSTGTTIIDGSAISELPVNTTMLIATAAIGSGPTNSGAGVASIGVNRMYIETDY